MSVVPPAENGTTSVIGLLGHASAACTAGTAASRPVAPSALTSVRRVLEKRDMEKLLDGSGRDMCRPGGDSLAQAALSTWTSCRAATLAPCPP
jgi:hypothetical protein